MDYGEEILTEPRIKMMEEVSMAQSCLHERIDSKMQPFDNKIIAGGHKSLNSGILYTSILAAERNMTAESVRRQYCMY